MMIKMKISRRILMNLKKMKKRSSHLIISIIIRISTRKKNGLKIMMNTEGKKLLKEVSTLLERLRLMMKDLLL